jgi:hypothetical protein
VVPCGDCAAACIVRAASIRAPGSDRWKKKEPSGRRNVPYHRTTFLRLAVPTPVWASKAVGLHPNGDRCHAFLPS